jgi:hypothetical protein
VSDAVTKRVEQAIRAVVPPTAIVTAGKHDTPFIEVVINRHPLKAYWLGAGTPGRVKEALALLPQRPDVLVARFMSPGAQEEASRARTGWIDESGAAEVALHWIVISRTGRGRAAPSESHARWTPATAGVAEALLLGTKPTVEATARATGLSVGLCTRALALFSEHELLASQAPRGPRSARRLVDPDRLLDEYSAAVASFPRTELRVGALWRDPVARIAGFGRVWDATGIRWAATGAVAAAVLAPYLTDIGTGEVFIEGKTASDLAVAADRVSAKPLDGGRLVLRLFPSTATASLSKHADGLCVAPWPRVYADLRSVGVRGEDAAEHLREMKHAR